MKPSLLVAAIAIGLAGCGSIEEHQVMLGQPGAPLVREAEVYMAGQPVARPFFEVALLQVVGHGYDANVDDVMNALRKRAQSLGCDAVVDVRMTVGATMGHAYGVCVRYSGAVAAPPAPPPPPPAPEPWDAGAPL